MKSVSIGIQKRMQRRIFLRPDRSLRSEFESSVAASRPSCVRARSLRNDQAVYVLGRYVTTELG